MDKVYLRMDDVGASSKQYEVYSKVPGGNFLCLKYFYPFKAWGPYAELSVEQWGEILNLLSETNAKLTVGVTAAWVEKNGGLTAFQDKYPHQARLLQEAHRDSLIEVANHGLSHCVIGQHTPRLFRGNRTFHREFWDWLSEDIHSNHIKKSQELIGDWLGELPKTLVPPGNVYSLKTVNCLKDSGIQQINSYMNFVEGSKIKLVNSDLIDAFHDRELVIYGTDWLREKILSYSGSCEFNLVRDFTS